MVVGVEGVRVETGGGGDPSQTSPRADQNENEVLSGKSRADLEREVIFLRKELAAAKAVVKKLAPTNTPNLRL